MEGCVGPRQDRTRPVYAPKEMMITIIWTVFEASVLLLWMTFTLFLFVIFAPLTPIMPWIAARYKNLYGLEDAQFPRRCSPYGRERLR
jgi:Flp pilus assembly protein TadB